MKTHTSSLLSLLAVIPLLAPSSVGLTTAHSQPQAPTQVKAFDGVGDDRVRKSASSPGPSSPEGAGPPDGGQPVLTAPSRSAGLVGSYAGPLTILYDQTDNAGPNFITSQEFEPALSTFDSQAADDFVVPLGATWVIDEVYVEGVYSWFGLTPLVDVYFYADAGGLPGEELYADEDWATFSDNAGSLTIDLSASPASLSAGTYWVSVRADMDFSIGDQWFWSERTVQTSSLSAWRNPGDGFGTGCTDWEVRTVCGVGSGPDLIFWLAGSTTTAADIDFFALGDSVASGHGLMDDGSVCHRSDRAYPEKMGEALATRYKTVKFPSEYFLACSGATALDPGTIEDPNKWLHNQVDFVLAHVTDAPTLVSITIGMNDFGWADLTIIRRILQPSGAYLQWVSDTTDSVVIEVKSEIERLLVYSNVAVVITLYHNPFNTNSLFFDLVFRSCNDIYGVLECYDRTEYLVHALNSGLVLDVFVPLNRAYPDQIRIAATHGRFHGHESPQPSCGVDLPAVEDTWIQYPGDPDSNGEVPRWMRLITGEQYGDCFHPNENGAQALADAVDAAAIRLGR